MWMTAETDHDAKKLESAKRRMICVVCRCPLTDADPPMCFECACRGFGLDPRKEHEELAKATTD